MAVALFSYISVRSFFQSNSSTRRTWLQLPDLAPDNPNSYGIANGADVSDKLNNVLHLT